MLVFLTNMASYIGPTNDPWFNATVPRIDTEAGTGAKLTDYYNPKDNSVMACFDHTQICNTALPSSPCMPLDMYGQSYLGNVTKILSFNRRQASMATRLIEALEISPVAQVIGQLNGNSMLAAKEAFDWSSPALPDNQWILELRNWFSASLILSQMNIRQYVTGFGREDYNKRKIPPLPEDAWMCHAQITQSTQYSSFSVFGLCMILIVGGLFIVVDLCLNTAIDKWRARNKASPNAHRRSEQWSQMALLNLHEKAYGTAESTDPSTSAERLDSTAPLLPVIHDNDVEKTAASRAQSTSATSFTSAQPDVVANEESQQQPLTRNTF